MGSKQLALRSLYYDMADDDGNTDHMHHSHKHWTFHWRCILHIAQSACKWALAPLVTEEIQTGAHMIVRSIINSSEPLHRQVDEFLHHRLCFDHDRPNDVATTEAFWKLLGVHDDDMLALFLEVDPFWDSGMEALRASGKLQAQLPASLGKVRAVVLFCMQWKNWSDTRWMKMCSVLSCC